MKTLASLKALRSAVASVLSDIKRKPQSNATPSRCMSESLENRRYLSFDAEATTVSDIGEGSAFQGIIRYNDAQSYHQVDVNFGDSVEHYYTNNGYGSDVIVAEVNHQFDDQGQVTVDYAEEDGAGGYSITDSHTWYVNNVQPTASLSVSYGDDGGDDVVMELGSVYDPSPVDTGAGMRFAWGYSYAELDDHWANSWTAEASHSFDPTLDPDSTLFMRIGDKDNGYSDFSTALGALPTINVYGSQVSAGAIPLHWLDTADDEANWIIQRAPFGGSFTTIATLDGHSGVGTAISYTDTTCTADTRYTYRLRASGNGADTAYSAKQYVRTLMPTPTNVQATDNLDAGTIAVTWNAAAGVTYSGFTIRAYNESGEPALDSLITSAEVTGAARSVTFVNLKPDAGYQFVVVAKGADSKVSSGSPAVRDQIPGYSWKLAFWEDAGWGTWAYNRLGWPHPELSGSNVRGTWAFEDGTPLDSDDLLQDEDTVILTISNMPAHRRITVGASDVAIFSMYDGSRSGLDVDPVVTSSMWLEEVIKGSERSVRFVGTGYDSSDTNWYNSAAEMSDGAFMTHQSANIKISMTMHNVPEDAYWSPNDLYLQIYSANPGAGNPWQGEGPPPPPPGGGGGGDPPPDPTWPVIPDPPNAPTSEDPTDEPDPEPSEDPELTENWDNLVTGGWSGFWSQYGWPYNTASTIETMGHSDSDGLYEPGNPPPLSESVFIPVNDGFDEGNVDYNGDPVPDNEPDDALGHDRVDFDAAPMWLDLWTTDDGSDAGSVTLTWNSDCLLLWGYNPLAGQWEAIENTGAVTLVLDSSKWHDDGEKKYYERMYLLAEPIGPSSAPHDASVTASFARGGAGTAQDTAGFTVTSVKLRSVAYDATNTAKSHDVKKDNGTTYGSIQYDDLNRNGVVDRGDSAFPVCYTRSGTAAGDVTLTANVKFAVPGNPGNNLKVRATAGINDDIAITFPVTGLTLNSGFATATLTATEGLPSNVLGGDLKIAWQVSADGGKSWRAAGVTNNPIYITNADPIAGIPFETELNIGCVAASGKSVSSDVLNAIWNKFASRNIRRADGKLMKYNHDPDRALTAGAMLSNTTGKGQCTAWAQLLFDTFSAQGISSIYTRIDPPEPAAENKFAVRAMPAQGSGVANYLPGTFARGGFNFHQVVVVGSSAIYDPSYGAVTRETDTRSIELKYEDENVTHVRINGDWVTDVPGDAPKLTFTP